MTKYIADNLIPKDASHRRQALIHTKFMREESKTHTQGNRNLPTPLSPRSCRSASSPTRPARSGPHRHPRTVHKLQARKPQAGPSYPHSVWTTACWVSAGCAPLTAGHRPHNEVGPQAELELHVLGGLADRKDTDRLMRNVTPRADIAPLTAPCPTCGRPAIRSEVRVDDVIATGNYLCPADHIWSTRWLYAPPAVTRA